MNQNLENLPSEIKPSRRFFLVGENKVPLQKDWGNPAVQKNYTEINGLAGFDTCGHGCGTDYLFLDFDHVLNNKGEFVNDKAADFVKDLRSTFPDIYIEKSISGTGLHAFLIPTTNKFPQITNDKFGVLHFDDSKDKDAPKLELFYNSKARYCLLTGDLYNKGDSIPAGVEVDNFFAALLAKIKKQLARSTVLKTARKEENIFSDSRADFDNPLEYQQDLIQALLDAINPALLEDAEWLAVMTACKNLNVSYSIVDSWNQQDASRYNAAENQARWDSLKDSTFGIKTLIGFAQNFGFSVKDFKRQWYIEHPQFSKGKSQGVDQIDALKAELQEAEKQIEEFEQEKKACIEKLKSFEVFDLETCYSPDFIKGAAFAKQWENKLYSSVCINIQTTTEEKGRFLKNWQGVVLEKANEIIEQEKDLKYRATKIKAQIKTRQFVVENNSVLPGLNIPQDFNISNGEIVKVTKGGQITICRAPVVITNKYYDVDTNILKWRLAFKLSNKWKNLPPLEQSTIADRNKLIPAASKFGFPVNSKNALGVIDYIDAFIVENEGNFPTFYTTQQFGWNSYNGKDYFLDPRRNCTIEVAGVKFPFVADSAQSQFAKSLTSAGSLEKWKELYFKVKEYPFARFIVSACLAAPLLKILKQRNFLLYIYGKTRAGKTTALLLGISAVGSEKMMLTFDATKNGLIGWALEANDYVLAVDEKQSADYRIMEQITTFIYSYGNGTERAKLRRDSSLRDVREWRGVAVMTGETPLTDDNVTGGANTRALQLAIPNTIIPTEICTEIRNTVKDNYGVAFIPYIEKILEYGNENLREDFKDLVKSLNESFPSILPDYLNYVTIVTLADSFLNQSLGVEYKTAYENAIDNAMEILKNIPTLDEISDSDKAKDMLFDFIAKKQKYFVGATDAHIEDLMEIYGKFDDYYWNITVPALRKFCDEAGLNYKKTVEDLKAAGVFSPADNTIKGRNKPLDTVNVRIGKTNPRCYRIPRELVDFENEK